MKVLFAHDHRFLKHNNTYYTNGGLTHTALKRYTEIFGELLIVSRQREVKNLGINLSLASDERMDFINVPNFKSIKNIGAYFKAKKIISTEIEKSDYVIARIPSSIGNLAIKYAQKTNKPYLIELVGDPWDSNWKHSFVGKIFAPIDYIRTKYQVSKSQYTIYVTKDYLQKRYPTQGYNTNCSNVALTDTNETILNRKLSKINLKSENTPQIIGSIGKVDIKYKGHKHVIKALSYLKKKGITNFEYQIVGGGNQDYLKEIAQKYNVTELVKFIGSLDHDDIFEWLDSIDIYIHPSETEGLPRSLIEAMSRGLLSFGSDVGGIPELLDEKCIYKISRNCYQVIGELLMSVDKQFLYEQALRNFKESKKYENKKIDNRRKIFLIKFRDENL